MILFFTYQYVYMCVICVVYVLFVFLHIIVLPFLCLYISFGVYVSFICLCVLSSFICVFICRLSICYMCFICFICFICVLQSFICFCSKPAAVLWVFLWFNLFSYCFPLVFVVLNFWGGGSKCFYMCFICVVCVFACCLICLYMFFLFLMVSLLIIMYHYN